jgi:hypothetical protein
MNDHRRGPLVFDDGYLPLPDLARYSGLPVRRLRDHLRDAAHPLPHYRIGGRVVVKRSEYDAWVQHFHCESNVAPEDRLARDILEAMRG